MTLSVTTEVWNFETKTSRTYNSFKDREYWNPILFLVDPKFRIFAFDHYEIKKSIS